MCGFAGIIDPTGAQESRRDLEAMTSTLQPRGPDGAGAVDLGNVFLGHRRLAIVDPAGGAQPMATEDAGVWLVANCEIYNHLELRAELESKGEVFNTRCDAEVILRGYRVWGPAVTDRLAGMFSFALWDKRSRTLLLARDRLGQKPLYYASDGNRFLFASEPKALLVGMGRFPGIDPGALARYLALDFVPTPLSIFSGIQRLRPAERLIRRGPDDLQSEVYWRLPEPRADRLSAVDLGEEIRDRFDKAVRRRLMSDVPVGVLLSGGLDSALVAASARSMGSPLQSFSLGFEEPEFDEAPHARRVAAWLGTAHREEVFRPQDLKLVMTRMMEWLDEPFADPSILAVETLSQFTATRVKVALGGDGADELFAGYDVFLAARLDEWTRFAGPLRARLLRGLASMIPAREQHFSLDLRLRQFARGLDEDECGRPLAYTMDLSHEDLAALLGRDPGDPLAEARLWASGSGLGALDRALRAYEGLFLESDILFKIDRAGMSHGLEIRSPFLDHELVECVARVPGKIRLPWLRRKGLMRETLCRGLPDWILKRRKQGFSLPVVRWINGELRAWFDEVLLDPSGYKDGLLDRMEVQRLLQRHRSGRENLRKPIWNLATLMLWKARWGICPVGTAPRAMEWR